jgi:hypothetical protein
MIWTIIVLVVGLFLGIKYAPKFVIQNNKFQISYKNSNKIRIYKNLF